MIPFDQHILFVLTEADAAMTAKQIAEASGLEGVTDRHVHLSIARLGRMKIGIVNWRGPYGGFIITTRQDLLYPHSVGSVIAECDVLAARKAMH